MSNIGKILVIIGEILKIIGKGIPLSNAISEVAKSNNLSESEVWDIWNKR